MSDMVERVARAIVEAEFGKGAPVANGDRFLAIAAIKAMRAPDKAMLEAAAAAMSPGKRPTQKRVSVKAKHGIRYRAMIDAALQDGRKDGASPKNSEGLASMVKGNSL